MSRRVLCKFFAHGACLKGEHCRFSHDWKDPKNHVCTYYQRGACSYGSRCRYEHVRVSQPQSSAPSSSTVSANVAIGVNGAHGEISDTSENHELSDDGSSGKPRVANLADHPLCSVAAAGNCPRGEKCPYIHGDLCASCAKHCLHPFRPKEREEHIRACQKQKNHLDALKRGQEIECSVCLDRVLSKPTAAERKFGLLSECNHPFCVSCIRNWRSSSPTLGMDVNSSLRACPICRKLSYFVIPSVTWYSSKEEKQEIIDSYKAKLRSIDCKHFEFGNGTCPFGSSCFYKHTVKPGSYLWNSAHGLDTGGPSFVDPEGIEILYDSDVGDLEDVDDLSVLLGHLHSPRGVEEFRNYIAEEDSEDRLIVDEEMALILMQTGFIMIDSSSDEDNYFP